MSKEKSLNELIATFARNTCKVSAPGITRCGCMEKTVFGTVAFLLDPTVKTALGVKELPNAHQVMKQLGCIT